MGGDVLIKYEMNEVLCKGWIRTNQKGKVTLVTASVRAHY